MNKNRNATLQDLITLIKKNNTKIKDKFTSKISSKENNAIIQEEDGLYSKDFSVDIGSLNSRSVIGKENQYGYFTMSSDQTINVNEKIKFDTTINSNGIELNVEQSTISIPTGVWIITSNIQECGKVGDGRYIVFNETKNEQCSQNLWTGSNGENYTVNSGSLLYTILKVSDKTNISIKKIDGSNGKSIDHTTLNLCIIEIGRTITLSPAQEANAKYGIEDSPVGSIISYLGLAAPTHYLVCDGSIYNIADYPKLAQHFADKLGSVNYYGGDGVTTFAVPDMRGEFIRGVDATNLRDPQGSTRGIGKHQDATSVPFLGLSNGNFYTYNNETSASISNYDKTINIPAGNSSGRTASTSAWKTLTSSPATVTIRSTNVNVLYCIKYEPTYFMNYTYGGFDETVLFEGVASEVNTYRLVDNVENYNMLYIEINGYTLADKRITTMCISTKNLSRTFTYYGYSTRCISFNFENKNLKIIDIQNINSTLAILKIVGIIGIKGNNNDSSSSPINITSKTNEEINDYIDKIMTE